MRKGWLRHLDFIITDIVAIILSITFAFLLTGSLPKLLRSYWPMYPFFAFVHISTCILLDVYNGILQRGYLKEAVALLKQEFFIASVLVFCFYFFLVMYF